MHRRYQLQIRCTGLATTILASAQKEIDLPKNRQFVQAVVVFLRQNAITRARVYLAVRREADGLLVYKLCIKIESEDKRRQQALAKAAAKHLFAAYVVSHAPERFQDVARELGDYSFQGDKFPRVRCAFEALDTLAPYRKSLEQVINMRALGLPGEEYLLCCDESFYRGVLAPRTPDVIGEIWARLLRVAQPIVINAAGTVAWQKLQPIILGAEEAAKRIKEMYPELVEFANAVLAWVIAHPYEAVGIVVATVVLTASVVGLLEAGVIGAGTAIVAGESIAETTAVPVVSGAGRLAAGEAVTAQMFSTEVATSSAARGLMTAEEVMARIGSTAVAANDNALVVSAVQQSSFRLAVTQTAVAAGAVGKVAVPTAACFALMARADTAYALPSPTQAPSAKSPVVSQGVSRLFMVRARVIQRGGLKPASNGSIINLNEYADGPPEFSNPFDTPTPIYTRLVGRVKLS